jgi:hypothetical protein
MTADADVATQKEALAKVLPDPFVSLWQKVKNPLKTGHLKPEQLCQLPMNHGLREVNESGELPNQREWLLSERKEGNFVRIIEIGFRLRKHRRRIAAGIWSFPKGARHGLIEGVHSVSGISPKE